MKKSLLTKLFAAVALAVTALGAQAAMPEAGKVYRVVNNGYGTALSDRGPAASVGCSAINDESLSQRWVVSAGRTSGTYVFRSLGTGKYLRSSNALSSPWTLASVATESAAIMTVSGSGSSYTVRASGANEALSMHCDGSGIVVCWDGSNPNSKWNFVEIPMTQAEIDAALNRFASTEQEVNNASVYQTALEAIFSDAACTTLKSNYKSMSASALQADANYKKLSAPLQQMVQKVKSGNWSETYGDTTWDSDHSAKYRVQLYEPFSEGSNAAQLAGIQAYTNMNNPTGIVANAGDVLYIMVEGQIKDGATLYLGDVTGYGMFNDCTTGTQLHEGLNIVPAYADLSHQFIYYTVNTVDWSAGKARPGQHKVTDYAPLKIHIEGGQINGFFNYVGDELYTPDTKDDFYYASNRAVHPMFDMMGKYVILHFFLFDTPSKAGATELSAGLKTVMDPQKSPAPSGRKYSFDMTQIMKTWDDMCFRERTLMGIQSDEELAKYNASLLNNFYEPLTGDAIAVHPEGDTWNTDPGFLYSDYFNNRMMGITMQGDLFMNATWWRTAYNISTLTAILKEICYDSGSMWGPAHEYGHMNQTPMKMAGTTEESNNIFSNVAVYYLGLNTSRSAVPLQQLKVFNQDLTYLEHDTWGTTRMFLQLWLYYHACGHNKKFYPRLYELLRNNPRRQSYYLNMRYDQCHFAKLCCIAAQEDLTDFFDAWGFFVPLDNYHIGDYSNFMATLTKEDAQAVKDEIAALGLPKNNQIILIDDRPGSKRASWYDSSMAIELAGPLGGVEDFRNNVKPSGSLSFTLDGSNLVVDHSNGTAGVGFLVYDQDGTLLSFSNDYTFPLKKAAVAALMSGTATVYAIGADGTKKEVTNDYVNAPLSEHLKNLAALVEDVNDVYSKIDEEETRAGWYLPFQAKPFVAAYEAAKNVPADADKAKVTELYLNLVNEYTALVNHTHAKVRFVPGSVYQIISAQFPTRALSASTSKATNGAVRKTIPNSQKWEFIAVSGEDNTYYIKNVNTGGYLGKPLDGGKSANGEVLNMADKRANAGKYVISEMETGQWALLADGDWGYSPNIIGEKETGGICLWSANTIGSQWYLNLLEPNEKGYAYAQLEQLVAEANDLLPQAGVISIDGDPVVLTEDMLDSNAKCQTSQYGDQFTSFNVILDGDLSTFFHSDYSGANTTDRKDHHITVDLGEGHSLNSFQIMWTNRDVTGSNSAVTNPQTVQVLGSNNNSTYTTLATLTNLPGGSAASYSSPIICDGNDYRYIRMMVTKGAGSAGGHEYFAISEFGLASAVENVIPDAKYPKVTPELMLALRDEIANSEAVLAGSNPTTTKLNKAFGTLAAAFNELAAAMGVETGILDITIDGIDANAEGIYDLQGRHLNAPVKGINIINGNKVLVK